jgi:hypothetical protein
VVALVMVPLTVNPNPAVCWGIEVTASVSAAVPVIGEVVVGPLHPPLPV